jgi:hypothetical protein
VQRLLFIAAFLFVLTPAHDAFAAKDPLTGKWKVQTKLVTAQDPVNQNYKPGDVRREAWRFKLARKQGALTTPSGVINGAKVGKAWVFEQSYDMGYGVILVMHIVARARSSELMKGTIEARYYSAQFGYQIGLDAWSFTGFRRL